MDQYVLIYYAAQIKISHILLIKLYQTNEPKPINFISGYQANIHNPNFVSVFKNLPLWIIKRNIFLLISNKSKSICPIKKFENYIFSFTLFNKILNIFSSDFIVLKIFERLQITIKALWCIARQQKTLFFEPSGVKTLTCTSLFFMGWINCKTTGSTAVGQWRVDAEKTKCSLPGRSQTWRLVEVENWPLYHWCRYDLCAERTRTQIQFIYRLHFCSKRRGSAGSFYQSLFGTYR